MIKATHKTIQDYMQTTSVPSRRSTASAPRKAMFDTILKGFMAERPPASSETKTGLSIQDYMTRRLNALDARLELPPANTATSSADDGEQNDAKVSPNPASLKASPTDAAASTPTRSTDGQENAIRQAVQRAAAKYDVPAGLIRSVIRCESNFDAAAVSHAGAQGLMQLMPATAGDLGVSDPFDIDQNIDGGTRYLRQMLDRFEGDVELALAAYNAGPGTVSRYGGVPPYKETQGYVEKVMRLAGISGAVRKA